MNHFSSNRTYEISFILCNSIHDKNIFMYILTNSSHFHSNDVHCIIYCMLHFTYFIVNYVKEFVELIINEYYCKNIQNG